MRILCLITIGSFLLSIVISENDVPSGTNVQRIPRALVLKPVLKVDSTEEEEDDGNPFGWIANAFTRMMRPSRKVPSTRKLLGPIRVPGLNDDVFIKQLANSNANSRIVIRVMPQSNMGMGMQMDPGQYYGNQLYQPQQSPQNPYFYNNQQQAVPVTRQQQQHPMQSSSGFVPVTPPTPSSWTRPGPQYYPQSPQYQQSYTKNSPLPPNYNSNYVPRQLPSRYQYSYPPSNYQPFSPYYPPYSQQNPYGTYDYDNSIPQNSGRTSNQNYKSVQSTNYPLYPPLSDQSQNFEPSDNNTVLNSYQEDAQAKTQYDQVQLPKAKPTAGKVSSKYNEVFRSDRMVPTNPTWRNRFWAKAKKTTTTSTTTTSTTEQPKESGTDEDDNDDQRGKKRSLLKQEKYSLTDIEEIAPPELTDKEKNGDSSSRMDEDGIVMKDGTLLGRGESQDHTPENRQNSFTADENTNWKPMAVPENRDKSAHSSSPDNYEIKSPEKDDNDKPEMGKRVMSLSNNNNNYWKHQNIKRPLKSYAEKIISSGKNKNKKIRIVENVQSSVSMVTSRGSLKSNSSTIKT